MDDPKYKIRKGSLYNRRLLSPEIWQDRNDRVCTHALAFLKDHQVKCFHVFLPIRKNNEVNLWGLIQASFELKKEIVISATDFETETMSHFYFSKSLVFVDDKFGIPTPTVGKKADLDKVELVFVPMLSGDKKGNRIGYGKGYYDRLLAEMQGNPLKVGITLNPLFDHFSFVEPHDVALDYCIIPHEVVKCGL